MQRETNSSGHLQPSWVSPQTWPCDVLLRSVQRSFQTLKGELADFHFLMHTLLAFAVLGLGGLHPPGLGAPGGERIPALSAPCAARTLSQTQLPTVTPETLTRNPSRMICFLWIPDCCGFF